MDVHDGCKPGSRPSSKQGIISKMYFDKSVFGSRAVTLKKCKREGQVHRDGRRSSVP